MTILTSQEFGNLFESFGETAFRLETLDVYTVPREAGEYGRFLAGEFLPSTNEHEWAQFVRRSVQQKKSIQRVHAISLPLTPYLKYEIEWGYLYSSLAGEDIFLMDRETMPPSIRAMKDFWLFDKTIMVVMQYDAAGHFLRGELEDSPTAIADGLHAITDLVSRAVPLKSFLAKMRRA